MSRFYAFLAIAAICLYQVSAFVPSPKVMAVRSAAPVVARKAATTMSLDMPKALAALAPAVIASPAFALDLPSMTVANEVQFPAYLAVFLGVGFPVAFLIATYIQSEARKAGEASGRGQ